MILDEKIIEEANSWLGTRWVHGQACKGVGADCIQFIVAIFKSVGLLDKKYTTKKYNRDWALHNSESVMLNEIKNYCFDVNLFTIKIGDIITYKYGQCQSHTAIYIGKNQMIHAHIKNGVIKSNISEFVLKNPLVWRLNNYV